MPLGAAGVMLAGNRFEVDAWRRGPLILFLLLGLGLSGCARYHPQPLETARNQPPKLGWQAIEVEVRTFHHPLLRPIQLHPQEGLSPEEAGVVAVVMNPSLRAVRDRRSIAAAQLFKAGILPNPQVSYSMDFVTGGNTLNAFTAYGLDLNWQLNSLITRGAARAAASAQVQSVELDIAWQEWQTAESAKLAAYRVISDLEQMRLAKEVDARLSTNFITVSNAVAQHLQTEIDLNTAEAASRDARQQLLSLEQDLTAQELALKRALGFGAQANIPLRPDVQLPSRLTVPAFAEIDGEIENQRLDLLALKQGYRSEEEKVRMAILGQFPRIGIGYRTGRDNSNIQSSGFGVNFDLPLFDRNQGTIAVERATRQQLFDEFSARMIAAHGEVASAVAAIQSLDKQVRAAEMALPALKRLMESYRTALEQGNVDVFSYYSAQNNFNTAQLSLIKLKEQLVENWIALELASGRFLPLKNG